MTQEETPVLPGDIDVLEQAAVVAAGVAARPARRAERAPARTAKEPKTTRSRAAATTVAVPVSTAAESPVETEMETMAVKSVVPSLATPVETPHFPALEENVVMAQEALPVDASRERTAVHANEQTEGPEEIAVEAAPELGEDSGIRPREMVTANDESVMPNPLRPSASVPMNPLEALPREERPLESRGVRFRGREGRVEVRGRQGMPIVTDPRAFRRQEGELRDSRDPREIRELRDPREIREIREAREPREMRDKEGNVLPGGRLASPLRDPRLEGRVEGREARGEGRVEARGENPNREVANREARGENPNREAQGRGRFERDLPRGRQELDLSTLEDKNLTELREIAKNLNIVSTAALKKGDLVFKILEQQAENHGHQFKKGILDILPDGKGFLRTDGYLAGNEDVYVSQSQIKRFNLKTGDMVTGMVRPPKEMERHYGLLRVEAINGEAPDFSKARKEFERLTPIFPNKKFKLEMEQENITARVIDLVTPIGKGQRGLIVAPPKAGKTTLIKTVANSIAANHPEVILIVLLIDERPEEVTDIARSVKGEVVASTFDELPENHMRVAEMVFEKAKRLAEQKKDVVILMDSLTRLARASNLVVNPSGRTMTGGLDPAAMHRPKRMFGAARNIEEGGSLTILATVLVDTGSRMDEYIFEELKGTGNMDLVLDRNLFDSRVFPAIDINKSGTRRDDLLLSKEDLTATMHLRRTLAALDNDKAIHLLIDRLKNTKTNEEFMQIVQRSSRAQGNS